MDFIERWFHVSPDGGNGMTELALLIAISLLVTIIVCRRQLAGFVRRRIEEIRRKD